MFETIRYAQIEDCRISATGRKKSYCFLDISYNRKNIRASKITFREIKFTEHCNEIHDSTETGIITQMNRLGLSGKFTSSTCSDYFS